MVCSKLNGIVGVMGFEGRVQAWEEEKIETYWHREAVLVVSCE